MAKAITIEEIDKLISQLQDGELDEIEQSLLKFIRSFYTTDAEIKTLKSIKTNKIIEDLWATDILETKAKKTFIKEKRKELSNIKSDLNKKCRDLFWADQNTLRIGIGRFNKFIVLKETKYEEIKHFRSEVAYLRSIINDIAPGTFQKVKNVTTTTLLDGLRDQLAEKKASDPDFFKDDDYQFDGQNLDAYKKEVLAERLQNSDLITQANEESLIIAEDLAQLNQVAARLQEGIKTSGVDEEEALDSLKKINQKKEVIENKAKALVDSLGAMQEADDPLLKPALDKMRDNLKGLLEKDPSLGEETLSKLIDEGMKALEEFEKGDAHEIDDDLEYEDKIDLEEQFKKLKDQAKNILNQFKILNKELKPLLLTQKSGEELSHEEKSILSITQSKLLGLQEEGTFIVQELEIIESKSEGALKEASTLIISSLKRFLDIKCSNIDPLVEVAEKKALSRSIRESGEHFGEYSKNLLNSAQTSKQEEPRFLNAELQDIQQQITAKKDELKQATEELDSFQKESSMESSALVISAREKSLEIVTELEEINKQALQIQKDIDRGVISKEEGTVRLSKLNEHKVEIEAKAAKLTKTLEELDNVEDPILAKAFAKMKEGLKTLLDQKSSDEQTIDQLIEEGLKAIKEFEAGASKDIHDGAEYDDKENIEEEFTLLKEDAKKILNDFKVINRSLKPLLAKQKTGDPLTSEESSSISINQSKLLNLQESGALVVEKLTIIEAKSAGALQEAAKLIISALNRFVGSDKKVEVLTMVSENSKVVDSLKDASSDLSKSKVLQLTTNTQLKEELSELEAENDELKGQVAFKRKELGSLKDTLKEISEDIIKSEDESLEEKVDAAKINTHQLSYQLSQILNTPDLFSKGDEDKKEHSEKLANELLQNLENIKNKTIKICSNLDKSESEEAVTSESDDANTDLAFVLSSESEKAVRQYQELSQDYKNLQEAIQDKTIKVEDARLKLNELEQRKNSIESKASLLESKADGISDSAIEGEGSIETEGLLEKTKQNFKQLKDAGVSLNSVFEDLDLNFQNIQGGEKSAQEASSALVTSAREKSLEIATELEDINREALKIETDIESGLISKEEGTLKSQELSQKKSQVENKASKLTEALKELDTEEDPILEKAFAKMKDGLRGLLEQKKDDERAINQLIEEGLKAIEEFEAGASKDIHDGAEYDDKENIEEEFTRLKEDAKKLLNDFKIINRSLKPLLAKQKTGDVLSSEEVSSISINQSKLLNLQESGSLVVEKLIIIESKSAGALKEAAKLIISALNRFVGSGKQSEVLTMVEENKSIVNSLQKGSEGLAENSSLETINDSSLQEELEMLRSENTELKVKYSSEMENEVPGEKTYDGKLESSKLVMSAREKSMEIANKIEKLNAEAEEIQRDMKSGRLGEAEGKVRLNKIEQQQYHFEAASRRLLDALNDFDDDPLLTKALDTMRSSFKSMINKKSIDSEDALENLLAEGLKAMEDFEDTSFQSEDEAKDSQINNLEAEFKELKEKAKTLLNDFKEVHKNLKPLLEKEKNKEILSHEEQSILTHKKAKLLDLQETGLGLLERLKVIDSQEKGPVKEAVKLIISALSRFVNVEHSKNEVLMLVAQNIQAKSSSLKELDELNQLAEARIAAQEVDKETLERLDEEHRKLKEDLASKQEAIESCQNDVNSLGKDKDVVSQMVDVEGLFSIDRYPVTIKEFKAFVDETGYKTTAEKKGWGFVHQKSGWIDIEENGRMKTIFQRGGYSRKRKASWYAPDGDVKNVNDFMEMMSHPVTQISYKDAGAYASWAHKRLPTRDEWILAAYVKRDDKYPWGAKPLVDRCNNNKSMFHSTSTVGSFQPNRYGLYDVVGNVWEICKDDDSHYLTLGGAWNLSIEDIGKDSSQKLKSTNFDNTIGFRCVNTHVTTK